MKKIVPKTERLKMLINQIIKYLFSFSFIVFCSIGAVILASWIEFNANPVKLISSLNLWFPITWAIYFLFIYICMAITFFPLFGSIAGIVLLITPGGSFFTLILLVVSCCLSPRFFEGVRGEGDSLLEEIIGTFLGIIGAIIGAIVGIFLINGRFGIVGTLVFIIVGIIMISIILYGSDFDFIRNIPVIIIIAGFCIFVFMHSFEFIKLPLNIHMNYMKFKQSKFMESIFMESIFGSTKGKIFISSAFGGYFAAAILLFLKLLKDKILNKQKIYGR